MAIVTQAPTTAGERRRLRLASTVTLEPIGEITVATADDVSAAVARARAVQPAWAARSVEERAGYLRRALAILLDRQEEYMAVIQRETGKPHTEALLIEIFAACDSLAYYAKRAPRILRPERRRLHGPLAIMKRLHLVYQPLGVVGVISPWNGPFILSISPVLQALVAGNAVLLKPSEVTPYSGKLVGDLFTEAGLPDGVLQILLGDGETGAALIEAGVDKITFTGSVGTGRKVAEACGRRLIPCTLELGGKDPMIVCADADLERAAGGAVASAFFNSGHVCFSTERVYAVESIADEFTRRAVERTAALRQSADGDTDIGAVFWPRQLEIIEAHLADAVAKGAKVLIGGTRNPRLDGIFFEPTVVTDVTHDMQLMRDETFGPILPIMRVRDEDEAVRLANDTAYGLGATIWTRDDARALALGRRIESGSVCVNDMTMTFGAQEAPFGGRKASGVGHVNGPEGPRSYCCTQSILIDRFGGRQAASHFPYSAAKDAQTQKFMRFLWGTRVGRWFT